MGPAAARARLAPRDGYRAGSASPAAGAPVCVAPNVLTLAMVTQAAITMALDAKKCVRGARGGEALYFRHRHVPLSYTDRTIPRIR